MTNHQWIRKTDNNQVLAKHQSVFESAGKQNLNKDYSKMKLTPQPAPKASAGPLNVPDIVFDEEINQWVGVGK